MLTGLKHLLDRFDTSEPGSGRIRDVKPAAAALLVEAALLDGGVSDSERRAIVTALERGLDVPREDAVALLQEAERREGGEIYAFTRPLKDGMPPEARVKVIEMLWEVGYADGEISDYESNLVRRVAGLLYVPDRDAGLARQRVTARMGRG